MAHRTLYDHRSGAMIEIWNVDEPEIDRLVRRIVIETAPWLRWVFRACCAVGWLLAVYLATT